MAVTAESTEPKQALSDPVPAVGMAASTPGDPPDEADDEYEPV
jgi:hypothetical protein